MDDDKCDLTDMDLIMAERYVSMLCERLREFHSECCSESHYVATIVLEDLMRKSNELKHQIINLRDAIELEHSEKESEVSNGYDSAIDRCDDV